MHAIIPAHCTTAPPPPTAHPPRPPAHLYPTLPHLAQHSCTARRSPGRTKRHRLHGVALARRVRHQLVGVDARYHPGPLHDGAAATHSTPTTPTCPSLPYPPPPCAALVHSPPLPRSHQAAPPAWCSACSAGPPPARRRGCTLSSRPTARRRRRHPQHTHHAHLPISTLPSPTLRSTRAQPAAPPVAPSGTACMV